MLVHGQKEAVENPWPENLQVAENFNATQELVRVTKCHSTEVESREKEEMVQRDDIYPDVFILLSLYEHDTFRKEEARAPPSGRLDSGPHAKDRKETAEAEREAQSANQTIQKTTLVGEADP